MSEISAARKRELRRRFNLGAPEPVVSRPGVLFYVTARDDGRTAALCGPYVSHMTALAKVPVGRRMALAKFAEAAFASFGTASIPAANRRRPRVKFGR